jgi:hypothetical protein
MFVIVTANSKNITKANPLPHLQMPAGTTESFTWFHFYFQL